MNRQIVLASRPQGVPRPENFGTVEKPLPEPRDGQVLLRHNLLGLALGRRRSAARREHGKASKYPRIQVPHRNPRLTENGC